MNSKDLRLGAVCAAAALWALWPAWLDASRAPANFGDLWTYHYPLRHLVVEALQQGRLPFWNAYFFTGLPLAANPQAQLLYPGAQLAAFLPLTLALSWDALAHVLWAMLGVALLARRGGLSAAAAWTLALLYALSPFLVFRVTAGIPTLTAALAWAPWCWLAWLAARPGWLAACFALQLLSGHPQFLVINAAAMGLWALLSPGRAARLGALARESAWALGLAAAQWVPTWEFLSHSVRRSWPAAYALGYSLAPRALVSLVSPLWGGDPVRGGWTEPASVFFETRGLSVGLAGLALALIGLSVSRKRGAALALLAAGVLLALGASSPLYSLLAPVVSMLRTPSRWLLLSLWGLLLAAGAGAARVGRRRGVAAAAFALVLLELCALDARFLGAARADQFLRPSAEFARRFADAPQRLVTSPELANPNKTALYHAANANGYEAFYLDGYPQYAARSEGKPAADSSRTYLDRVGTPELDRLAVRWRVAGDGSVAESKTAQPPAYFVDEKGAPVGEAPAAVRPRPELWDVKGAWPEKAAALVLAQPAFPGWTAWLDGKPAASARFDGLLQAVPRPSGAGSLDLAARFAPTGWPLLVAVTLLSWAHWLARAEAR